MQELMVDRVAPCEFESSCIFRTVLPNPISFRTSNRLVSLARETWAESSIIIIVKPSTFDQCRCESGD